MCAFIKTRLVSRPSLPLYMAPPRVSHLSLAPHVGGGSRRCLTEPFILMMSGSEKSSLSSVASLRLADWSCVRLLKEKLICSLPTLYMECVIRLRAVS